MSASLDLSRQKDLVVSPEAGKVLVVGGGAIGSNVAVTLALTGIKVHIVDGDNLSKENLAPGLFSGKKLGRPKHEAIAAAVAALGGDASLVTGENKWFSPESAEGYDVVVLAVDSLEVRREIYEALSETEDFERILVVDGRIGGHITTVFTVWTYEERQMYLPYLQGEVEELPCGRKATAYITRICSGLIVSQIVRHLNLQPTRFYFTFSAEGEQTAVYAI